MKCQSCKDTIEKHEEELCPLCFSRYCCWCDINGKGTCPNCNGNYKELINITKEVVCTISVTVKN